MLFIYLFFKKNWRYSLSWICTNRQSSVLEKHINTFVKEDLEKILKKITKRTGFFHYENVQTHLGLSVREFMADKKILMVSHCLYSPDLVPCNFLSAIKSSLKEQWIQYVEKIKANATKEIKVFGTLEQFQKTQTRAKSLGPM